MLWNCIRPAAFSVSPGGDGSRSPRCGLLFRLVHMWCEGAARFRLAAAANFRTQSRGPPLSKALSRARPCRALLQQTEAVSPDPHPYDKPRVNLCNPLRHAHACRWVGNRLANGDRIDDRLDPTRHPWLAKHE